mgnify:CR=1 FL=1
MASQTDTREREKVFSPLSNAIRKQQQQLSKAKAEKNGNMKEMPLSLTDHVLQYLKKVEETI